MKVGIKTIVTCMALVGIASNSHLVGGGTLSKCTKANGVLDLVQANKWINDPKSNLIEYGSLLSPYEEQSLCKVIQDVDCVRLEKLLKTPTIQNALYDALRYLLCNKGSNYSSKENDFLYRKLQGLLFEEHRASNYQGRTLNERKMHQLLLSYIDQGMEKGEMYPSEVFACVDSGKWNHFFTKDILALCFKHYPLGIVEFPKAVSYYFWGLSRSVATLKNPQSKETAINLAVGEFSEAMMRLLKQRNELKEQYKVFALISNKYNVPKDIQREIIGKNFPIESLKTISLPEIEEKVFASIRKINFKDPGFAEKIIEKIQANLL